MNICKVCLSKNRAEADARLLAGNTQAAVARWLRVDRQVVGRHVRRGHVARGNPAAGAGWTAPQPIPPDSVYVYSGDEVAMMAWVDERYVETLASATGVDRAEIERHWSDLQSLGVGHDESTCAACRAIDGSEAMLSGLEAAYRLGHTVAPGWFEPRATAALG